MAFPIHFIEVPNFQLKPLLTRTGSFKVLEWHAGFP